MGPRCRISTENLGTGEGENLKLIALKRALPAQTQEDRLNSSQLACLQ